MRLIDADELRKNAHQITTNTGFGAAVVTIGDIDNAPTIDPDSLVKHGEWIPVESEPAEPDSSTEYEFLITSPLPDSGQEILVTNGESVWCDIFYDDDGCYTDGGYNFGTEIIAWMPLPKTYKE